MGSDQDADYSEKDLEVDGDTIRFMWDYGVIVPLWDDGGLLPDDPMWLRTALGFSDELIADLTAWGTAMNTLDTEPPTVDLEVHRDLDEQARGLVARLREELPARFRVVYKPWGYVGQD